MQIIASAINRQQIGKKHYNKINTFIIMTGQQLFEYHLAFRDFSGTDRDEYAQTLETAFMLFGDEVFAKLEQAEKERKKIELIEDDSVIGAPTGIKLT